MFSAKTKNKKQKNKDENKKNDGKIKPHLSRQI